MKKHIKIFFTAAALLLLCCGAGLLFLRRSLPPADNGNKFLPYGVFIGLSAEDAAALNACRTVVIDAANFSAEEVKALRGDGHIVYSYLNIGSIENFRDYDTQFEPLTLDDYENWPEERWMDVSSPLWQAFVADTLAPALAGKGVDGFFVDNTDVYGQYPRPEIYEGLVEILRSLQHFELPVILNGGDLFVSKVLDGDGPRGLFSGVNQEGVFTSIDFQNGKLQVQNAQDTVYYQAYLGRCKQAGLTVFLTEYGADDALQKQISAYCEENGFFWYNALSPELNG